MTASKRPARTRKPTATTASKSAGSSSSRGPAKPKPQAATPSKPSAKERPSLSTLAYEALRARLRSGQVTHEDRLVDLEIAPQLGMSRMPVREALLQLVAEGCLVSTARGYRIPTLSRQDVLEVFELRLLLDPRAAALAARNLDNKDIAGLKLALAQARTAVASHDAAGLGIANVKFREIWTSAVSNQRLAEAIGRYADQILTVRIATLGDTAIQPIVLDGLTDQYQAFASRDPIAAQDATLRFVLAAERAYLASQQA